MVDLSKLGKTKKKTQEEMSKIGEPLEDAMDQMLGHMPKTKKKAGRPKKIIMESSSSESEEEKPKPKKKVGRPKKVVESSSSESEEEKPKKKPVGRPKKCSCGSGLDVEPAYKKFFSALKENTTLK
jgi:hypothetical protein